MDKGVGVLVAGNQLMVAVGVLVDWGTVGVAVGAGINTEQDAEKILNSKRSVVIFFLAYLSM